MDYTKDYYKILGVDKDASEKEIKLAYRRMAKRYHPDLNRTDPNAKEKFIEIKEAYDVLTNPIERKIYDRSDFNLKNIDHGDLIYIYGFRPNWDLFGNIYTRKQHYYRPPPEDMYT